MWRKQVLDVVADAPGAVGAEVGEVLAHLGRVDAGHLGQPLGRDGGRLGVDHLEQAAEVDGQAGDGGLGDAAAGAHAGGTAAPAVVAVGVGAASAAAAGRGRSVRTPGGAGRPSIASGTVVYPLRAWVAVPASARRTASSPTAVYRPRASLSQRSCAVSRAPPDPVSQTDRSAVAVTRLDADRVPPRRSAESLKLRPDRPTAEPPPTRRTRMRRSSMKTALRGGRFVVHGQRSSSGCLVDGRSARPAGARPRRREALRRSLRPASNATRASVGRRRRVAVDGGPVARWPRRGPASMAAAGTISHNPDLGGQVSGWIAAGRERRAWARASTASTRAWSTARRTTRT